MGRYRLGHQIGKGSTGAIFAGEFGPLRRPVAIKLLHEHLIGDASARRMVAEARMLSRLDHPGIVKVFDVGEAKGRAFIVMERISGESLRTRLARERLSEQRVVLFARQLASALEAAHEIGIVHRDLKPENVLIVADPDVPGGERVKLIDFGIAKQEALWSQSDTDERTDTGVVLGTPKYMAPEQWERAVDPRADIYSLGVVLYVMATGELPFTGNTNELLAEHAYCAPPRAAERASVSSWLSSIIDRCLAKRPDDRFPTMTALAVALRSLEHAIAPPTGSTPRFDDEDDDAEELTTPGPRALGTSSEDSETRSEDSATKVVPFAIGTARNRRRTPLTLAVTTVRAARRRPARWLWPLCAVVAALIIMPMALIPPLRASAPGVDDSVPDKSVAEKDLVRAAEEPPPEAKPRNARAKVGVPAQKRRVPTSR